MHEIAGRSYARLTSWLPERESGDREIYVADYTLPPNVGSVSGSSRRALCIGPGDWVLITHDARDLASDGRLRSEATEHGLAMTDLSDALVGFGLHDIDARTALASGCGLDFHPRAFSPGHCARTRLAQIPVVVECVDVTDRLELLVSRSYASYLADWLADASLFAAPEP
ncbi:MAG: sarcosine oxidase subunit gamma family protein [Gammaproteobacteria bacterium]